MRVFITGGTGFIGSNLALYCLDQGHNVTITAAAHEQPAPKRCIVLPHEFSDWKSLGKLDMVFHQAALNDTTLLDKRQMFDANVSNSQKLFEQVVHHGCKRIVYASSTAVYGNIPPSYREDGPLQPRNPYGESKRALEELSTDFAQKNSDCVIVGLRYCNVYGPRENHKGKRASMIYQLAQQMIHHDPCIFRYGEQKRDYVYIDDVIRANMLAAQATSSCIVNCGSGTATTFNNIIRILNETLGIKRMARYKENPYESFYQNHTQCDMTRARESLGFVPEFTLREGIQKYYESGWLAPTTRSLPSRE